MRIARPTTLPRYAPEDQIIRDKKQQYLSGLQLGRAFMTGRASAQDVGRIRDARERENTLEYWQSGYRDALDFYATDTDWSAVAKAYFRVKGWPVVD